MARDPKRPHEASDAKEDPSDTQAAEELMEDLTGKDAQSSHNPSLHSKPKKKHVHKLSLTATQDFNETLRKRGVVYIARVPPKMTPTKLKSLLEQQGEVTRLYLVPEDAAARKRRKLNGGSASKRFVEGWIEFADKRVAKYVARTLNNTVISNRKRDAHYGDLWNLKYLRKFQWAHLTEKVAYERRVREQKLRLETMQARKETVAYKQLVETGKKLDKIQERRQKRAAQERSSETTQQDDKRRPRAPQVQPVKEEENPSAKRPLLGALV